MRFSLDTKAANRGASKWLTGGDDERFAYRRFIHFLVDARLITAELHNDLCFFVEEVFEAGKTPA